MITRHPKSPATSMRLQVSTVLTILAMLGVAAWLGGALAADLFGPVR